MVVRIIKNPPPVEEKQIHTVRGKCKECGNELDPAARSRHRLTFMTCIMKPE
jgi:hypothetical protein